MNTTKRKSTKLPLDKSLLNMTRKQLERSLVSLTDQYSSMSQSNIINAQLNSEIDKLKATKLWYETSHYLHVTGRTQEYEEFQKVVEDITDRYTCHDNILWHWFGGRREIPAGIRAAYESWRLRRIEEAASCFNEESRDEHIKENTT